MKRWFVGLVAVLAVGLSGWGITRVIAQSNMDDHMVMMQKMMMNRPKELKKADMTVQAAKQKAMKAGKYNCCLKHPCDFCALKMGACPCGKMAAMNQAVCNECKGGWYAGDSAIPGKTADEIKTMPRMDMKMSSAAQPGNVTTAALIDVWHCPITGAAIPDHKGVGEPVVVGNYRVHFCCGGCPAEFAKLSDSEKQARAEEAAKKDG